MLSRQSCRRFLTLVFILMLAPSGIVFASTPVSGSPSVPADQINKLLQVGENAPANTLRAIDDNDHAFPIAEKWNMIFYWSLFCHSCIEEMPVIQERLQNLSADNLVAFFVSLDTQKMQRALVNFCKRRNLEQTVLMEQVASESYFTADQWGVVMTPSVFIVAPDGKIAYSHQGPMDIDQFFADFAAMKEQAAAGQAQEQ